MPTLAEFIRKVEEHGWKHEPRSIRLRGTSGERELGALKNADGRHVVLPSNAGAEDRLTLHVLRSLCARLSIDPSLFELDLDSWL